MSERGSTHHTPRIDDQLAEQTDSLTRGAPVEARAEDWRRSEPAGDGEPLPDARIASPDEPDAQPGSLGADEVEARSVLAISLRPSAFPADREELLAVADAEHAESQVFAWLRELPGDRTFDNVQQVWEALGGASEARTSTPREADEVAAPAPEPPRERPSRTDAPAVGAVAPPPSLFGRGVDIAARVAGAGAGAGSTLARTVLDVGRRGASLIRKVTPLR